MADQLRALLPGWRISIREHESGESKIILTDEEGRTATAVGDQDESTLDSCREIAFEIEKHAKREWNRFLYDLARALLQKQKLNKSEYNEMSFGSWVIQAGRNRLVLNGKDKSLSFQELLNESWERKELIHDFTQMKFIQFKSIVHRIV